ncbi:MAG TPA: GtrA family protein [Acidimicrobiales bacterium]|nr:GtrA family protein [Acidimicrobiales bacterium]
MSLSPRAVADLTRSATGRKAVKFAAVSAICVVVTQGVLFLTFGVLRLGTAIECNVIAIAVAAVPSYLLNRRWTWGRTSRSRVFREVLPFWTMSFTGLVVSTGAAALGAQVAHSLGLSHLATSITVNGSNLAAYAILWVGKFLFLDRLLFADRGGRPGPAPGPARSGDTDGLDLSRQSA